MDSVPFEGSCDVGCQEAFYLVGSFQGVDGFLAATDRRPTKTDLIFEGVTAIERSFQCVTGRYVQLSEYNHTCSTLLLTLICELTVIEVDSTALLTEDVGDHLYQGVVLVSL